MPFINESLSDVGEAKPAPEGEYDLRILKATDAPSKKGHNMLAVLIGFNDGTDAPPFGHWVLGWDRATPEAPELEDDEILRRKRDFKRFCMVFDLAEDFDVEDLKGETGNCFVTVEESDDGQMRNRLKLPRMKD